MTTTKDAAKDAAVDCASAMQRLWEYLDGALPEPDTDAIRAHIEGCASCEPHSRFERELKAKITAARREHDDVEGLRRSVLAVLRHAGLPERAK